MLVHLVPRFPNKSLGTVVFDLSAVTIRWKLRDETGYQDNKQGRQNVSALREPWSPALSSCSQWPVEACAVYSNMVFLTLKALPRVEIVVKYTEQKSGRFDHFVNSDHSWPQVSTSIASSASSGACMSYTLTIFGCTVQQHRVQQLFHPHFWMRTVAQT